MFLALVILTSLFSCHKERNETLDGDWKGTYTCSQGETGLTLSISARGNKLTATFSFYPVPSNPGVPTGSYKMEGTIKGNKIDLSGTEWINQPSGYSMIDVIGTLDETNKTISGSMCAAQTPYTLTKQ